MHIKVAAFRHCAAGLFYSCVLMVVKWNWAMILSHQQSPTKVLRYFSKKDLKELHLHLLYVSAAFHHICFQSNQAYKTAGSSQWAFFWLEGKPAAVWCGAARAGFVLWMLHVWQLNVKKKKKRCKTAVTQVTYWPAWIEWKFVSCRWRCWLLFSSDKHRYRYSL